MIGNILYRIDYTLLSAFERLTSFLHQRLGLSPKNFSNLLLAVIIISISTALALSAASIYFWLFVIVYTGVLVGIKKDQKEPEYDEIYTLSLMFFPPMIFVRFSSFTFFLVSLAILIVDWRCCDAIDLIRILVSGAISAFMYSEICLSPKKD